ncbi:MAG TPA: FAD-dependent oxidoreductase [Pseudolysinimonas sp.]|nr:FAD-dependent oxidoreductase [Pseudolysinimonas sp.]
MTDPDVVIAGGGPAGLVAGYLFARAGLRVTVLEKHADFLRDFRGDTIHPSTITLLRELGLAERFLALPLTRLRTMDVVVDGRRTALVDFGTLPSPDNFLVFAPQWDFLNFIAGEARRFPGFELRMSTEAVGLIEEGGVVRGVTTSAGDRVRARLTIAADGRDSRIRAAAGFEPEREGVPIDVLWFHLPKPAEPPPATLGYIGGEGLVLTIERGDRYQSGMVIEKGGFAALQRAGLEALRARIVRIAPVLRDVVASLTTWDQIKLLSVQLDHLPRWWRDGLICIGDAAHAMSPVGGVGVNYAIQDAVALANAAVSPLRHGSVPVETLAALQQRRERPVQRMQRIQRFAHERISRPFAGRPAIPRAAAAMLIVLRPVVRRAAARLIGRGFLPEHANLTVLDRP